jgi:hypothetical protein
VCKEQYVQRWYLQGTLEVDGIALEIGLIEKLNIDTVWQLDSRA